MNSQTIDQSKSTIKQIGDALFAGHAGKSFLVLVIAIVIASLLGKLFSLLLRRLSRNVGRQADASSDLGTVNRLRRFETWIILSIAIVRVFFIVLGLYFWWVFTHANGKSTGLVGASALLVVIIGGVFSPLLRDFAFGSGMMAEHWFGVGDLITIEPNRIQGVVERITLRSTRIRGLNGEVIWVSNQNIWSASIAQKGTWPMAIELFVTNLKRAEALIERTNVLLPTGPALVASRLEILSSDERSQDVWHVTAVGETAPGREWLLERTAVDLLKKLDTDSSHPVLITDPVARYADRESERQFTRAVTNARKVRKQPRRKKNPVRRTGSDNRKF